MDQTPTPPSPALLAAIAAGQQALASHAASLRRQAADQPHLHTTATREAIVAETLVTGLSLYLARFDQPQPSHAITPDALAQQPPNPAPVSPSNLVLLDDHRPVWATSSARCGACGHRWVATWPAAIPGTKDHAWECPACHSLTGLELLRH